MIQKKKKMQHESSRWPSSPAAPVSPFHNSGTILKLNAPYPYSF